MANEMVAVVAAASSSRGRGIGYQGKLPWKLPADMKHFQAVTTTVVDCVDNNSSNNKKLTKNAVIMGRKTWESIPPKFRPLKDRINVILTSQTSSSSSSSKYKLDNNNNNNNSNQIVMTAGSLQQAADLLNARNDVANVFVIGGGQVYQQALEEGFVQKIIYTDIRLNNNNNDNDNNEVEFDTFFPDLPATEWTMKLYHPSNDDKTNNSNNNSHVDKENNNSSTIESSPSEKSNNNIDDNNDKGFQVDLSSGVKYRFLEYTHRNTEELQYLDLCRTILERGIRRGDRTGTGTLSIFGTQMRFSLRQGTLPLLTTKRTFWRGVAEELLWFISGNTNANDLAAKDIHIWDGNGSREFLDQRGLGHRQVGDLGPVYGFQWRHFGAKYVDMHTDYTGQGVDQLQECIDKIKHHPEDRRIILSAWNPADLDLMALPPCHMFCQFYVDTEKNEVSCHMYQRSADMGLGVPFNIASYALLTHMIAHVTGRKPGDFVHTIGDAHIYLNHVDALKEQLKREPRAFPTLVINPEKKNIDDFVYQDFEVIGYKPHKTIKMKMAV